MGGPGSHGPMGGPGSHGPMGGPAPRGPHVAPPPPRHGYAAPPPPRRRSSLLGSVIAFIIVLVIVVTVVIANLAGSVGSGQKKSHKYTKLDSGVGYRNDCIIDELGWFDNVSKTESRLQSFYNKTGVQPYIYLVGYDTWSVDGLEDVDSEKEEENKYNWAKTYYDEHFTEENIFLLVYFAEEDTDNVKGDMCYINGEMVSSVMDSSAVDIFWNNLDRYWSNIDISTDDVFVYAFTDTASTLMSTNVVLIVVIISVAVIVILLILFNWWKKKAKRAKEEAAETERILNTPMETLVDQNLKDLENKYK
jgi:hypothetical protein